MKPISSVFITMIEADFLAAHFKDARPGTIGWSIYEKCRKRHHPPVAHQFDVEVRINQDEADIVAATFADASLGGIENNIYEKCRRRDGAAFVSLQWK